MNIKDFRVRVKADERDGLAEGEFVGYASVFGNVDSYGEVVAKGAFAESLKEWSDSGGVLPVLWGHNMSDPDYNIGGVLSAEEDERGLKVHARLDMDSPKGAQVYRLLKGGRVGQMSFAFDVLESHDVKGDDGKLEHVSLDRLKLYEVSIVPIGANQETEILAVKSATDALCAKAGRVISAKNETTMRDVIGQLRTAADDLEAVLPESRDSEEDQDQTSGKEPSAELPSKAASDQTTPSPSVSLALHLQLLGLDEAEGGSL
ncbi:HK97 family phage prohead protease [Rhodococcus spongiicola]|uniref:HK97 family phage prohead protease n=1 Tax=Rhodococcus spongiicola TaxID=2487352 RepID=A0A3S3AB94_9NOCA|nr:HK97 family phage prohead protease [Rhodococcus spongiicola]RVW06231.1 HK97 family phage prohead protease [Rhodococcus spongiicola]